MVARISIKLGLCSANGVPCRLPPSMLTGIRGGVEARNAEPNLLRLFDSPRSGCVGSRFPYSVPKFGEDRLPTSFLICGLVASSGGGRKRFFHPGIAGWKLKVRRSLTLATLT